ncbi:MAG TPA: GNAT family N-acetyltransferase [Phycisphaerae bacterium]|nr:GNAT family N-acetyltransferase [Phycisphaerae bacterium]
MPPTIQEVSRDEAPLIMRLVRAAFGTVYERFGITPENWPRHASNLQVDWIQGMFDGGARYFVVRDADEPAGCVALQMRDEGEVHVRHLAVLPACRGKRLGGALLAHAIGEARRLGAQRVTLGLIADDAELEGWYRRRGFEVTGKKRLDDAPFEITLMARDL